MVEIVKGKKNKKKVIDKSATKNVKTKKSCHNVCLITTSLIIIAISYFGYKFYKNVIEVPEKPYLNENFWWGPGDAKTNVDTSIRPFRILFTDAMEEHFRRKSALYRSVTQTGSFKDVAWTYGVHSEALARVFSHWIFQYKFKERQRYFNQYDHFKTNIQGLDIHFLHVKPKIKDNVKVLPILLLHGWPGSIREFYEVIPQLTSPREEYDFAFEVIVPSLPGFGYSQASSKQGLGPAQVAVIMRNLMNRLGFHRYFIQGGDFGQKIGSHISTIYPEEVLGLHINGPVDTSTFGTIRNVLDSVWKCLVYGDSIAEKMKYYMEEFGYMHIQGTKPDTIGVALNESPAGLLAYIIDRFQIFSDPDNKFLPDGGISKYNMTDLIDNVMMYWATESITTSMRLYKEMFQNIELENTMANIPTPVPTWAFRLKNEVIHQSDSILQWKYPNLLGSTKYDFGGHYAAFERPNELADDIFKSVKKFLEFRRK